MLVAIAAPATASPVMLTSPAVAHLNVFAFDAAPYAELAGLGVSPLRLPDVKWGEFDFSHAQAVALEWADATIHGPGSHAFGLVGLMLWVLWWRRRLPALDDSMQGASEDAPLHHA